MLAVAGTIFLLSPIASISPPPPLAASPSAIRTPVESRFLGHANSNERIEVAVRPDGTPVRIVVTQRLDLTAKGDYYFVIPAPATRVLPGPGSESQPGLARSRHRLAGVCEQAPRVVGDGDDEGLRGGNRAAAPDLGGARER